MAEIKLDIIFEETAPDFGSVERTLNGDLQLLEADKTKLNSMLTRATCTGKNFAEVIKAGTSAVVLDNATVWVYHAQTDTWYEVISNE